MRTDPFQTVVIVDWSASAAPSPARPSADAIWIGVAQADLVDTSYHRTRRAAEAAIRLLLATRPRPILLGFDFPMGYPSGFAARLTGRAQAAAVWAWLAGQITDAPDNRNNRFQVADAVNRQLGGSGPFWGRPAALALPHLPARKLVDYPALGLAERRAVERMVPRAQPVWKLFTTGSVGSQSLMGLPVIHRLAADCAAIWPFDRPAGPVVVAEVYPSLLAASVARDAGTVKDEVQVRLLARALWRLSQAGRLADLLVTPDGPVPREEGWILGAGHADTLAAAL